MADNEDNSSATARPSAEGPAALTAIDDLAARRVWPHQAPALRWLREDFVAAMLAQLHRLAAGKWHLRLAGAALLTKAQFVSSVEEKTCCYALALCRPAAQPGAPTAGDAIPAEAPAAAGWIETTPSIAFPILNCLLGGSSDDNFIPQRPLTTIERRLLLRLMEIVACELAASWPAGEAPPLAVDAQAVLAPLAGDDSDAAMTASFDFGLDRQAGTLRLSLSAALAPQLSSPWSPPSQQDSVLEISAVLAESGISPRELADLKPGDVLTSAVPVDGEVIIRVAGIPKFVGQLGTCNGRRAVTIIRRI